MSDVVDSKCLEIYLAACANFTAFFAESDVARLLLAGDFFTVMKSLGSSAHSQSLQR